jgi:hypothetical protein
VAKLLRDLDKPMRAKDWERLWPGRDAVTFDMSKSINADHWMPERVYRYYANPAFPSDVEGVNVCFFHGHAVANVPIFVVGKARYVVPEGKKLHEVCRAWDFVDATVEWSDVTEGDFGKVMRWSERQGGRVDEMRFVFVDLCEVTKFEVVESLLQQVRNEFELAHEVMPQDRQ